MDSLYLLIPLSLVIVALAVWIFFRMSDSGQFDDMEGPAHSILMDDDRPDARRPPPHGTGESTGGAGGTSAAGMQDAAAQHPDRSADEAGARAGTASAGGAHAPQRGVPHQR